MKFKIGDKVMLKAVPYDDFFTDRETKRFYKDFKKEIFTITKKYCDYACYLDGGKIISFKYLKHAVKPKPVKYTIDCRRMSCGKDCPERINGDVKICEFTGTKAQVEAHIKKYWKQPKIKVVK
jgi:hypothetical protein